MSDKEISELRQELEDWKGRLDRLRVQANLGKMELRDKLEELEGRLEPVQRRAGKRLAGLAESGAAEAVTLVRSLQAGWEELRRTHRELSQEAEREAAAKAKRSKD